jgi:hypothetical protein
MGYHSRCHFRVPPTRVQAWLIPCEYPEYPDVGHSVPRESISCDRTRVRRIDHYACAARPGTPGTPSAHSADGARVLTPALRCRAARSPAAANCTGPAADAAPGTPPAHAGTPSAVPSHRATRDIDRDIMRRLDPPRPRDALPLGGTPTVPRALEDLSSEGTRHTLAALRDLMRVLTVPRALRAPDVRTTHRDVSWQLYCPM